MQSEDGRTVIATFAVAEPGTYELVLDPKTQTYTVRSIAGETERVHPCERCSCCGECGCERGGACRHCWEYATWAKATRQDLAAYRTAEAESEPTFTETRNRVHAVGCPSHKRDLRDVERLLDGGCPHGPFDDVSVPRVITTSQVHRNRRRCRTCCPDLVWKVAASAHA